MDRSSASGPRPRRSPTPSSTFVIVDGRRFNDELLRRGYARLLVIAPNGRHGRDLLEAELEARREGRGLWGRCPGSP
ncbi:MAG: thermonuclease family protein [Actinobacteria bacterium]|nr:thermonuclease family protein [Actinomycetota bacterium]